MASGFNSDVHPNDKQYNVTAYYVMPQRALNFHLSYIKKYAETFCLYFVAEGYFFMKDSIAPLNTIRSAIWVGGRVISIIEAGFSVRWLVSLLSRSGCIVGRFWEQWLITSPPVTGAFSRQITRKIVVSPVTPRVAPTWFIHYSNTGSTFAADLCLFVPFQSALPVDIWYRNTHY